MDLRGILCDLVTRCIAEINDGNDIKEPFHILSSEEKIILANNHQSFNKDVLYYKDKANKVYVYYDSITMQYLGYSEDNKNIKRSRNSAGATIANPLYKNQ